MEAGKERLPGGNKKAQAEKDLMEQQFQVGVISSTHGVRGEVKVFPTTDDVKRFKKLKHVLLDTGKEQLPLEVEQVKFFKQFAILKFKGIDNINDIEKYKGKSLLVDRKDAVKLKKDEYFIADMIGMHVVTEDGAEFGTLPISYTHLMCIRVRICLHENCKKIFIVQRVEGFHRKREV